VSGVCDRGGAGRTADADACLWSARHRGESACNERDALRDLLDHEILHRTAIALLHSEQRLDWTKPVRDYLPEFRLHDPVATERVTIRDLLSHQSGLPRHDWVHLPGDRAPAEMLGVMRHLELSRDIRSAYQYSNLCYNVAGLLIERISRQSYEAFIRARLTERLGMTVGFTLNELEASTDPARPYMMHEDRRLPAMRLPIRTTAAGAINTSVVDLANWMRLHL